jgi:hypothetical protein
MLRRFQVRDRVAVITERGTKMLSNLKSITGMSLLLAGALAASAVQAQQTDANATSNMPSGSGEASTMTRGVPNLLASNPQADELGIQTRLSVRPARVAARAPSGLNVMGAAPASGQPLATSQAFDPVQSAMRHRDRD